MYHISLYWKRILASSMPSLNNRLYKPSSSIEYVNTLKTKSIDNDNTSIPSFLLQNCTNLGILMGVSQYVSVSQSVSAIWQVLKHWTSAWDNQNQVEMVFLDLTKAFDTVNQNVSYNKVYYYGIRGLRHKLITPYLSQGIRQDGNQM